MNQNDIFQLRGLLQQAQSILIAIPHSTDVDVVGSALGIYLVLSKIGKKVSVICPEKTKVGMAHLFAIDKISSNIAGTNNLVISFPYQEGTIEKVSYHIEGNKFNLVIEPRTGQLNFNQQQVDYTYGDFGDFDLILAIGARDISNLGNIYSKNQALFSQKPVVNIDKNENNTRFAKLNFITKFTISQFIALLLKALRMPLDQDAASNILTGIAASCGTLPLDSLDPDMLESVAYLKRAKGQILQGKQATNGLETAFTSKPVAPTSKQIIEPEDAVNEAPEDWFKPKIYTINKNKTTKLI